MEIEHIVELLDNSQDAETIALEIVSNKILWEEMSLLWDDLASQDVASDADTLGILIRELWDIAYSHGYYDGQTEAEEDII